MTTAQIIIAVIICGVAALAALGTMLRMVQEKNRLWGRYQHLKAIMQRQDYFRNIAELRESRREADGESDGMGTVVRVDPNEGTTGDVTPVVQPATPNAQAQTEGAGATA